LFSPHLFHANSGSRDPKFAAQGLNKSNSTKSIDFETATLLWNWNFPGLKILNGTNAWYADHARDAAAFENLRRGTTTTPLLVST
jgi:hypothetical protein